MTLPHEKEKLLDHQGLDERIRDTAFRYGHMGHEHPFGLMALTKLFARVRLQEGLWPLLLVELIEFRAYDISGLARILSICPRTLKRILIGETQRPSLRTGFKILIFHAKNCSDRYRELPNQELALILQES